MKTLAFNSGPMKFDDTPAGGFTREMSGSSMMFFKRQVRFYIDDQTREFELEKFNLRKVICD